MTILYLFVVVFAASFIQGAVGFGVALVAMPLLVEILGSQAALPLGALAAQSTYLILLIWHRHDFNLRDVGQLIVAAIVGIPVGVIAINLVNEAIILKILGLVLVGYVVYSIMTVKAPPLSQGGWAYAFGFASGLMSGAFNMPGPPLIAYGQFRQWDVSRTKANLQVMFLVSTAVVIATHMVNHNITPLVWRYYLSTLPAIGLGMGLGIILARHISQEMFRKGVLLLLLVLGLRLVF